MTSIGDIIDGKYRIERQLGAGSMGFVFAATHLHLNASVALKFIRWGVLDDRESLLRFRSEGNVAARLRSVHAPRIYDLTLGDRPYLVMEYLEGQDLDSLLKAQGMLVASEACDYIIQACEVMAEAHAMGLVHRDLKPANLFLAKSTCARPIIKVLDFGVVKVLGSGEMLTQDSFFLGSPAYIAPEQIRSARDVDARSDLWSLGAVLYKLISGRAPFRSRSMGDLCARVKSTAVSLDARRAGLPTGLSDVVGRCLEPSPEARYSSAAELAHALRPFTDGGPRAGVRSAAQTHFWEGPT